MWAPLEQLIGGRQKQLLNSDLDALAERHPFSIYLNYCAWSEQYDIYLNQDASLGMIWECSPVAFASEKTLQALEGLFRAGLPGGSVVQVMLYADAHIGPLLDQYRKNIVIDDPVVRNNVRQGMDFLLDGREGLVACADIPVRNFRLFFAVKIPGSAQHMPTPEDFDHPKKMVFLENVQRQIGETLRGAKLYPRAMRPGQLLDWLRRLFNSYGDAYPEPERNLDLYDERRLLNEQVINADTVIREHGDSMQIGDRYFACITPKAMPKSVDGLQTSSLFGGIWGVSTDMDQIKTGFLYTLNILIDDGLSNHIRVKTAFVLKQKGFGTFAMKLAKKQAEFTEATDKIEHGEQFVRIVPELLVFNKDREKTRESLARAIRLWENQGYVMQQEGMLRKVLFISALPFGFYNQSKNVEFMERDFICSVENVLPLMPIQGDFSGTGTPRLLFMGRKGQLIPVNFYEKGGNNYNALCAATSGSGKSFLINYIVFNYLVTGAFVRIIDIGGSYRKIANMFGAVYLDFQKESAPCLNPFTHMIDPDQELASTAAVFAQMTKATSSTEKCTVTEENIIKDAVRWAWDTKGQTADSDTVYEFLTRFPDLPGTDYPELARRNPELSQIAGNLAYNIRNFTSKGAYGQYFTGPSTLNIHQDPFVVLELETLKTQPDLYRVVTMLVIDSVTQDLYLSDRSRQRFVIFEEAWQFLGQAAMLKPVVEEGYRRARKYNGSFMVVVQSITDMEGFGDVGKVILGNSAYKMFLESGAIDNAQQSGVVNYDEFTLDILKSVKSSPPKYSEIFFDTPFGTGVARLVVNPYAYFVYTSNPGEIAAIEEMKRSGMSYDEAICEMVRRRRQ